MKIIDLEICAGSVISAENAQRGGADRIELCHNLNEGGTTPSYAAIDYCVNKLGLRTYVLVRPRPGGFTFTDLEHEIIKRDVEMCRQIGAAGVVIGSLDAKGNVDMQQTTELVSLAGNMEVTFHRAFDRCANPIKSLHDVIECGCTRILTSGCRPTAMEGIDVLRELVREANGKIKILAGSGVTAKNAIDLLNAGIEELHGSCKHLIPQTEYNQYFTSEAYIETDCNAVAELISTIEKNGYQIKNRK